ncbi:MAG: DUF2029 domain-containing protein [Planctomycetaceae bacterium]|nr:DUF2029 domain-containing protein [Planctomycetaceae bacterium]
MRRFRRITVGVVIALVVFGLTDVRRRAQVDPARPESHRTDLTIFTTAGAAFLADADPYEVANPRGWKFAYPPFFALCVAPLAQLPTAWQAVLWYGASLGMLWLTWREAMRISRRLDLDTRLSPDNGTRGRMLGWAAGIAVALPVLNCLQRGQVGIVNLWLLVWGFRLLLESNRWRDVFLAGVVLAIPGVIKVTPALPAVTVVAAWSLRTWRSSNLREAMVAPVGLATGALLFLIVIPGFVLGWQANFRHLQTWYATIAKMAVDVDPTSTLETPYTLRNQNLSNAVYRSGNWIDYALLGGPDDRVIDAVPYDPNHQLRMDSPTVSSVVLVIRLLLLAVLGTVAVVVGTRGDDRSLAGLFGLACVLSLVVSPMSRGHYFVLLLPAVLWSPCALLMREWTRSRLLMICTPAVLTILHYAALDVAGRAGLLGIGITIWFLFAAVWEIRRSDREKVVSSHHVANPTALRRAA